MTAPIVSAGGAPQAPVATHGEGRRRSEASPADGTFAAVLAALAPMPSPPDAPGAGAAVPTGQAPPAGAGLPDPIQALLGPANPAGPQAMLPAALPGEAAAAPDGQADAAAAPAGLTVEVIAAEQAAPGQAGQDPLANLLRPQGPEPPGPGTGDLPAGAPAQGGQAAPVEAGEAWMAARDRPQPAVLPDRAPAGQAAEADAAAEPPAGPASAGMPEGRADPAALEPLADEGFAAWDGASAEEGSPQGTAVRQAPDAAPATGPDPGGGAEVAARPVSMRGLERLTAGRLQAEHLVNELTRALPELPDGQYRLTLRLHPEHLGEVRLELHLSGREVYAAMEVSSADARHALESRGEQLRQGLSDAGYQLAGFEVATGQGRQARQGGDEDPAGWPRASGRSVKATEAEAAPAAAAGRSAGPRSGRLDTLA